MCIRNRMGVGSRQPAVIYQVPGKVSNTELTGCGSADRCDQRLIRASGQINWRMQHRIGGKKLFERRDLGGKWFEATYQ